MTVHGGLSTSMMYVSTPEGNQEKCCCSSFIHSSTFVGQTTGECSFFLALRTSEWVPSWRQKHDCLLMFLIVALLLLLLLLNHNIYIYYLLIITINSSIFGMMTLLTLVFLIVVELAGYWWLRDVFFILTSRNFQPVHDYGPSGIP